MKKLVTLLVLLSLCLGVCVGALAADPRIDEIEYKGFGVIKL